MYGGVFSPLLGFLGLVTLSCSDPNDGNDAGESEASQSSEAEDPIPEAPVFTRDVAPIVYENCTVCHHEGGAGPFPLLNYGDVAKRARQIADVTASRYMPPWLPDPKANHFQGERVLRAGEIATIARWVEQGTPEGDPAELPAAPKFSDDWQLGEPDLVVTMPEPFLLPADGPDVYRNFVVPIPLERSRFVRGMELRPGNPQAAHHAFMLVDSTRESRRLDALDLEPGFPGMDTGGGATSPGGHFISWQPGKRPSLSPPGMSWRLAKGSDLVLQMHMQTTGKEERIQASVAYYFTDEAPRKTPYKIVLRSTEIDIPPGEAAHVVESSYRLPVAADVLAVIPHAHYLGKQLHGYATLPDGSRRWLLKIDDWDFNWQGDYRYREPLSLPKGTILTQRFTYDNSAENPRNPHSPPERVTYGLETTDEMGELWLQLLPHSAEDYLTLQRDYGRLTLERNIRFYGARVAANPASASDHAKLGKAQFALGKLSEAQRSLAKAIELDPSQGEPFYLLGMIEVRRNNLARAWKGFETCLAKQPQHIGALNGLGMLALRSENLPAALQYFRAAEQADPENDTVLYNLGMVLVRLGRLEEGIPFLEKCLAIDPAKQAAADLLSQARARLRN